MRRRETRPSSIWGFQPWSGTAPPPEQPASSASCSASPSAPMTTTGATSAAPPTSPKPPSTCSKTLLGGRSFSSGITQPPNCHLGYLHPEWFYGTERSKPKLFLPISLLRAFCVPDGFAGRHGPPAQRGISLWGYLKSVAPTPPLRSRYNRITRHTCRHRRSCREGGDPVRYGLR